VPSLLPPLGFGEIISSKHFFSRRRGNFVNPPKLGLFLHPAAGRGVAFGILQFFTVLGECAGLHLWKQATFRNESAFMTQLQSKRDAIRNSTRQLASTFISRTAALGSTYLTAAFLGSSYLGMTIATSVARHLLEYATGLTRKI
jgi:hypothetical protein